MLPPPPVMGRSQFQNQLDEDAVCAIIGPAIARVESALTLRPRRNLFMVDLVLTRWGHMLPLVLNILVTLALKSGV